MKLTLKHFNLVEISIFKVNVIVGNLLAFYISHFEAGNQIGWNVIHTIFGWIYIIYYFVIRK
jgi:hypothetical protein